MYELSATEIREQRDVRASANLLHLFSVGLVFRLLPVLENAGVGDMVMATVRKGKPELRKKGKRDLKNFFFIFLCTRTRRSLTEKCPPDHTER